MKFDGFRSTRFLLLLLLLLLLRRGVHAIWGTGRTMGPLPLSREETSTTYLLLLAIVHEKGRGETARPFWWWS